MNVGSLLKVFYPAYLFASLDEIEDDLPEVNQQPLDVGDLLYVIESPKVNDEFVKVIGSRGIGYVPIVLVSKVS